MKRTGVKLGSGQQRDGSPAVTLWELLGLGAPEDTDWMRDGLCAQTDPEEFFPNKGSSTRAAKAVCATCPVETKCLLYALEHNERFGVWGGTSERERRKLRHCQATAPSADRRVA
jgi:WhiB family redox-sensing transcriptional regulator